MTLLLSGKPCYITTDTRPTWSGNNGAMHHNGITMQTHRIVWGLKAPNPIPIGFMSNYIRKIYKCKILISVPCTTLKFLLGGPGVLNQKEQQTIHMLTHRDCFVCLDKNFRWLLITPAAPTKILILYALFLPRIGIFEYNNHMN